MDFKTYTLNEISDIEAKIATNNSAIKGYKETCDKEIAQVKFSFSDLTTTLETENEKLQAIIDQKNDFLVQFDAKNIDTTSVKSELILDTQISVKPSGVVTP